MKHISSVPKATRVVRAIRPDSANCIDRPAGGTMFSGDVVLLRRPEVRTSESPFLEDKSLEFDVYLWGCSSRRFLRTACAKEQDNVAHAWAAGGPSAVVLSESWGGRETAAIDPAVDGGRQAGLSAAQVEDRSELAALWRKGAVKPVSTRPQVFEYVGIGALAFSHDSKHLAITGRWRNLSIWNTADWSLAKSLELEGMVQCLAFSSDDRFLYAGGSDDRDTLHCRFDWRAGKLDKAYEGHEHGVRQLVLSPDGRTMISFGYMDRTVHIWDVETAKIRRSLKLRGDGIAYAPKRDLLVLLRGRERGGAIVHLGENAAKQIPLSGAFSDAVFSADEKFLFTFGSALEIRSTDDPARVLDAKDFPERMVVGCSPLPPTENRLPLLASTSGSRWRRCLT